MSSKRKIETGDKATDRLYGAVANYIKKRGGSVVVIGGVAVVEEPSSKKYSYGLMVRITGKKPDFAPTGAPPKIKE